MALKATRLATLCLLLLVLLGRATAPAQEAPTPEEVEAAFLYHFAEFVTWPPEALPATNTPILFGLLGEDAVGRDLEAAIRNKEINGHPLRFEHFDLRSVTKARRCQILFIDPAEKKRVTEILAELRGASVLTVSRMNQFTEAGGIINFYLEEKRGKKVLRFEINDQAARQAGLKISAKLLSLARKKEGP
jgi:hypothetical protein